MSNADYTPSFSEALLTSEDAGRKFRQLALQIARNAVIRADGDVTTLTGVISTEILSSLRSMESHLDLPNWTPAQHDRLVTLLSAVEADVIRTLESIL